jgi:uncharacterized protein
MRQILEILRQQTEAVTHVSLSIQTNGIGLHEEFCRLFVEHRVRVGLSLDGDRAANDRHRRFPSGSSSHAMVLRALALLRRPDFRHLYGGLLCTVDLTNDPITVYKALLMASPPQIDFLLPHATWDNPPLRHGEIPAPYAKWLGQVYLRWSADGRPVPIRIFNAMEAASRGLPSGSEAVGLDPVGLAVIETDGAWEQVDSLKTAYEGAPETDMTIFQHTVDELLKHAGMAARQSGLSGLCAECRSCPVVYTCGGGLYSHRYRTGSGFDNPSVYCDDLKDLALQITMPCKETSRTAASRMHLQSAHRMQEKDFDLFASGAGTVEGMAALLEAQISIARISIGQLGRLISSRGQSELSEVAIEGWSLLEALDASHRECVTEVLSHPYVQIWAARCLVSDAPPNRRVHHAHIAGIAAAAALLAGVPVRVPLPIRDGLVHIPGEGAYRTTETGLSAMVLVDDRLRTSSEWLGCRRLRAPGLDVQIEDLDPYRDCYGGAPEGRLSVRALKELRDIVSCAQDELARLVPTYAVALRAGLRAVVPLDGTQPFRRLRTGRPYTLSGFGVDRTANVTTLTEMLIWEFQLAKLDALFDAFDLYADEPRSMEVSCPQNFDPVRIEELFRQTYGLIAVCDLRAARSIHGGPQGSIGTILDLGRVRDRADRLLDALMETKVLTLNGRRFASGMRMAIDRWKHG